MYATRVLSCYSHTASHVCFCDVCCQLGLPGFKGLEIGDICKQCCIYNLAMTAFTPI